uniref:Uncharacterized protein n=1 Tax=Arundo donax TaxID=35708 RepID=A0A0A9BAD4_ARUDO
MEDAGDLQALRRLRSCGQAMYRLRRRAAGPLFHLTGHFSNSLARDARQVLSGKMSPAWIAGRLKGIAAQVEECLGSNIYLDDMEPDGDDGEDEDEAPHEEEDDDDEGDESSDSDDDDEGDESSDSDDDDEEKGGKSLTDVDEKKGDKSQVDDKKGDKSQADDEEKGDESPAADDD